MPVELLTPRLRLRPWREADRAPLAALNADPAVMEFLPAALDRAASDAMFERLRERLTAQGWGLWATERRSNGAFVGFIGLAVPGRPLPCMPCVEIGWRLARAHWGQGLASEGARAALRFGFEQQGLDEIVSFTALGNLRSRAVMARIGMRGSGENFEHPALPEGHALRPHCLYRLDAARWRQQQQQQQQQ